MLSQANYAAIAAVLNVTPEALKAAVEAKEEVGIKVADPADATKQVDADFTGLKAYTPAQIAELETNTKNNVKGPFHQAGRELLVKELKTKAGVEVEGKDADAVLKAIQEKAIADAKLPVDEKVKQLEAQLETVRTTAAGHETKVKGLEKERDEARFDSRILASLPKRNNALSDADYLMLVKSRMIREVDAQGKETFKNPATGGLFQDGMAKAFDLKGTIEAIFKDQTGWAETTPDPKSGRGGGSSRPPGAGGIPTSLKEAQDQWLSEGKSLNDPGLVTWVGKLQADNKDFVMNLEETVGQPAPASK